MKLPIPAREQGFPQRGFSRVNQAGALPDGESTKLGCPSPKVKLLEVKLEAFGYSKIGITYN
jgi:hypothetical protein